MHMIKTKHYENVPSLRMWSQKQEPSGDAVQMNGGRKKGSVNQLQGPIFPKNLDMASQRPPDLSVLSQSPFFNPFLSGKLADVILLRKTGVTKLSTFFANAAKLDRFANEKPTGGILFYLYLFKHKFIFHLSACSHLNGAKHCQAFQFLLSGMNVCVKLRYRKLLITQEMLLCFMQRSNLSPLREVQFSLIIFIRVAVTNLRQ